MDATRPAKATLQRALLLLLLSAMAPALSAQAYGKPNHFWDHPGQERVPTFEDTPTDIQAFVGQTVILPCNVADLGDKVVSWMRTSDLQILTSDLHTFTSDNRFGVLHTPSSTAWNLRIIGAKLTDEGKYECQVSTDPKMNRAVFLRIPGNDRPRDQPYDAGDEGKPSRGGVPILRQAKLLGPAEQFVSLGSTVTFTCLVSAPYPRGHPPHSVLWLHRGRIVSIQAERGGISISTVATEAQTTSRLTVAHVGPADAGNYTCAPTSGVTPATLTLVVMDGERTEAMQRNGSPSGAVPPPDLTTSLTLLAAAAAVILSTWRPIT